ncbi:MAG: WbqC family protein [Odoribacter sp.]
MHTFSKKTTFTAEKNKPHLDLQKMNTLLLSTAYFPPVSYFAAIKQAPEVVIEQFENFAKQSYRNRCLLLSANGVIPLTVPVAKANSKTLIRDLKIIYAEPWQKIHLRGITSAYKNSPYYDYYIDELMPYFERKETYLFDLNTVLLEKILEIIPLHSNLRLSNDYLAVPDPDDTDLRNAIHPKPARRTPAVPLPLRPYRQTFNDRFPFTPDLSILDLLFCTGPDAARLL